MKKLLGLLCLVGLVYFADALTKQVLFHLIHQVGNNVRQEHISQVKSTHKEALEKVMSPEQSVCINGYIPTIYKDLNMGIGLELDKLRSEYGSKTSSELENMTEEQEKENIEVRVRNALKSFKDTMKQIRKCVE